MKHTCGFCAFLWCSGWRVGASRIGVSWADEPAAKGVLRVSPLQVVSCVSRSGAGAASSGSDQWERAGAGGERGETKSGLLEERAMGAWTTTGCQAASGCLVPLVLRFSKRLTKAGTADPGRLFGTLPSVSEHPCSLAGTGVNRLVRDRARFFVI